ncbi:hypothetical protein [Cysteiniphilum sp. JM-1]|uniref:hypothetical protein n=1 Tax=Cysteiniphilum sp. JM-1 TaxID=2610891 RepID=UPI00124787D0|nr:hypothetical protein [Cysteiniphilum sp. JM-1]
MSAISKLSSSSAIIFKLSALMILAPLLLGCKSSGNGIDFNPESQGSNNPSLKQKERELQHVEYKIAAAYNRLNEMDEQMHHKQSQLEILDQLAQQQNVRLNQQNISLALLNIDLRQKEESVLAYSEKLEDKANQLNQYEVNLADVMLEVDTKQQRLQTIMDQISLKQQELEQKNNQLSQYQTTLVELTRALDTKQQSYIAINEEIDLKQCELSNINDDIISNRQLLAQKNTLLSEYDDSITLKNNRIDELDTQTIVKRKDLLEMDRQLQRKQEQILHQSQQLFAPNEQMTDQIMIENINVKEFSDKILQMIELYFQLTSSDNGQLQERSSIANSAEPDVMETPSQLNDLRTKIVDELKIFYQYIQQNHQSANDHIEYVDYFSSHNNSFASDRNTQASYIDQEELQVEVADVQVQTTDDYIIELNKKLELLSFQKTKYIEREQQISDENRRLKQDNSNYKQLNDELITYNNDLITNVNNLSTKLSDNEQLFERKDNELEGLETRYDALKQNADAVKKASRIIEQNLENALYKIIKLESKVSLLKDELSITKQVYQDELEAFAYKEIEYNEKIKQLSQQSPQQIMLSDSNRFKDSIFSSCYRNSIYESLYKQRNRSESMIINDRSLSNPKKRLSYE